MTHRMAAFLLKVFLLLTLVVPAVGAQSVELRDASTFDLSAAGIRFYRADPAVASQPPPREQIDSFLSGLEPVEEIDHIRGGSYWMHVRIDNRSDVSDWVFDFFDIVGDTFDVYAYSRNDVSHTLTGLLHPGPFAYYYGTRLQLPPGESVDVLVFIKSKCFSGTPHFQLITAADFEKKLMRHYGVLMACFGALIVLAIYNGLVGFWIRDRSFVYYSAYLLATILSWAGIFNVLSYWVGISATYSIPAPFYLLMGFSSLYFIHFLELKTSRPALAKICYGFAALWLGIAVLNPLFHPGWYMAVLIVTTMIWASLATLVGLLRLRDGYKPARFFVLVFALVSVSSAISALDSLGVTDVIEHHYLVTMVTQSIDMGLLALGLADRINISREQREEALQQSVAVEQRAAATERKASEKLQQALTLSEKESEKKSEFLRMVSHELRTPLHSIISATEQWSDADGAARQELIECLGYGATRLRTQVDNLVLYAETDAETIEINASRFELRQLIDRVIDKTRPKSGERVQFHLDYGAQVPRLCVGDSYLIEHMLRTVLDNAFKYTTCGRISLGVQWETADNRFNIELNDTGCGMTQEQLDHVYRDFVQVSRGLNRSSEGLGLGLTVCYRLAAILGADLRIDSEPGVGTQVSISLPLQAVDTHLTLIDDTTTRAASAEYRVLLVEDNDVNAMVIARVLTHFGYRVERAVNGQEAVERVIASDFDLILMDIQMPVMDGITAARWIRRRGIESPIVAISANSDMSVRKRCAELGMSDFLVKPVAQVDLQRVAERLLRGAGERAS